MPLSMHERLYGVDVEPMATRPPFALGVYFGPNRIMAAMVLSQGGDEEDADDGSDDIMLDDDGVVSEAMDLDDDVAEEVGLRTEIDNLKVVASIQGSMEYQSVYQEVRAKYVKFTLAEDEPPRVRNIPSLIEDKSGPPKKTRDLPPHELLDRIFDQELQNIKQRAEHNLGQRVQISAISLPDYWYEDMKHAVVDAASQPHMMVPYNMLIGHVPTARLAYNLGNPRRGTWLLVTVEYNTQDLYLTFAEISDRENPRDHPKYPVDGHYLLENLGEDSPTRAGCRFEHYANIKEAFNQFLPKHVAKDPDVEFPYSDIRGIILTGDASDDGMRTMDGILREVFADLPQCASGNIFTSLRPSHVVALGAARAVRAKTVNNRILRDVYEKVAIED